MKIAFFGLGNMGFPIAANLLRHGHAVTTAVHRSPDSARRLEALGAHTASTPAEAVKDAELIFTIVPNDQALKGLLLDEAMLAALPSGSVIVEMTSASAEAVGEVAAACAARGVPCWTRRCPAASRARSPAPCPCCAPATGLYLTG